MNIDDLKQYCLRKGAVSFDFPFDETTLVFRIGNKIFALVNIDSEPLRINLKQDPELIPLLKEQYSSVLPGYHMNKKHWITAVSGGDLDDTRLKTLIDESYNCVRESLSGKLRKELNV